MFLNDDNDQVSLRGTVIIIANHGERIDIPAGGIMVAMLVMVMMMVSMMMTVMVMARIIAESIELCNMDETQLACEGAVLENKTVSGNLRIMDH